MKLYPDNKILVNNSEVYTVAAYTELQPQKHWENVWVKEDILLIDSRDIKMKITQEEYPEYFL